MSGVRVLSRTAGAGAVLRSSVQIAVRRPATMSPAASQLVRRHFSTSNQKLCASCSTALCSHTNNHNKHHQIHTQNIQSNLRKASSMAAPNIPKEQWAQVLEQKGGSE